VNREDSGVHPGKFVALGLQLGLLLLVIRQFQIESSAFLRLSLLAFAGFAVHYFLPLRFRLPLFVLLSLAGILLVFGFANSAWLVGFGLLLIAICRLPIALRLRVLLLLVAGGGLAALRSGWLEGPWSAAIWPILGSMFMFRILVYLYDIEHEKGPTSTWRTLAYFFMLPNVCFPLFPVVDYKTFGRTHYDADRHRIYQTGIEWMVRGVVHLVLYRVVYYHLTLAPSDVIDPDSLVRFLVSNFLLYLRISGHFHIIVGMLHLFGFNLPETNRLYCLSSSFTDFWRRINIYWKDFMMKVFYYPMYFRLRKSGPTRALVVSTLLVFGVTWLLHSYQWFWLRGSVPLTWQDGVFWGTLAALVLFNSLRELKHGRQRSLGTTTFSVAQRLSRGLATVGVFLFICLLWSVWTSQSFSAWFSMWDFLGPSRAAQARLFPGYFIGVSLVLFASAALYGRLPVRSEEGPAASGPVPLRPALGTLAVLVALAAAGIPAVYKRLPTSAANAILSVRKAHLSRADTAAFERGYYENLTRVDRFNSQLWEIYMRRPVFHWLSVESGGLVRLTGDFLEKEMVPGFNTETPFGTISVNRWGMRDLDYERLPEPGTYRMAFLGASSVLGWGVEQHENFESLLEAKLNATPLDSTHDRYEILNMAVAGYFPLQQLLVVDKALTFEPQALLYFATDREALRSTWYLSAALRAGRPIPYDYLQKLIGRARIDTATDETTAIKRLEPFKDELLDWLYQSIAARCRGQGVQPAWVFLPSIREGRWAEDLARQSQQAEAAGFLVLDLSGAFDGHAVDALRLAEWDNHPNALGHRLVAERLFAMLQQHPQAFF